MEQHVKGSLLRAVDLYESTVPQATVRQCMVTAGANPADETTVRLMSLAADHFLVEVLKAAKEEAVADSENLRRGIGGGERGAWDAGGRELGQKRGRGQAHEEYEEEEDEEEAEEEDIEERRKKLRRELRLEHVTSALRARHVMVLRR